MNSRVFAVLALFAVAVSANHNCGIESRYCQNGGICHDPAAGASWSDPTCLCPAGYAGADCSFRIRECTDSPCMNGGSCQPVSACSASTMGWDCFKCTCPPGWAGAPSVAFGSGVTQAGMCEYFVGDPCGSPMFCQNGGTCIYGSTPNVDGKYTCVCTSGWYGANCTQTCDTAKAGGATAPCAAGTCKNAVGQDGSCDCTGTGKFGPTCADTAFCGTTNPCKNSNPCTNTISGTGTATDPYVYTTGYCGTQSVISGKVVYNCVGAFRGQYCDQANFCTANTNYCQNGGTCNEPGYNSLSAGSATAAATSLTGTCTCVANKGFGGPTCSTTLSGCFTYNLLASSPPVPNPYINQCSNGGMCPCDTPDHCTNGNPNGLLTAANQKPWSQKCQCSLGWGDCRCNTSYSSICVASSSSDNICRNGGSCAEFRDSWECSCRRGFWGARCENYDNPCLNSPCQNNGRCRVITNTNGFPRDDRFWAWECDCKYPYYGARCENKADLWNTCTGTNPCLNGGTCLRNDYHVDYSDTSPSDRGGGGFWHVDLAAAGMVDPNNFGIYRIQDAAWKCKCPTGFYGVDCSLTTDPKAISCPASNPCLNGGTCFVTGGNLFYSCACPCGYSGHLCQIQAVQTNFGGFIGIGARMQFCSNGVACQNGGKCVDTKEGQGFSCLCATSYYGYYCELKGKSAAASVAPSMLVVAAAAIIAALKF